MKTKSTKVYTLPQVGKLLGVGLSTVYDYINVGLIHTELRDPGKVRGQQVSEAEYGRLKRDGVDSTGIKAELAKRGSGRKAAKKQALRGAPAAAAKKRGKRKATAAVAKKQVKRAAARKVTKRKSG